MINKTTKNLKEDYPTRSIISNYISKINARIDSSTVTPDELNTFKTRSRDKFDDIEESLFQNRTILTNHTSHIS